MYMYRYPPGWMVVDMSHNHLKRKWWAEQCVLIHIFFAIDTSGRGASRCECRRRQPYVKAKLHYHQNGWTNIVRFGLKVALDISESVLEVNSNVRLPYSQTRIYTARVSYTADDAHCPSVAVELANGPLGKNHCFQLVYIIVIVIYNFSNEFLRSSKNN